MTSNKFSHLTGAHGTPPICISKIPPPYVYTHDPAAAHMDPILQWAQRSTLPPVPSPNYKPIAKRNLIYHVFPFADNMACFENLIQLKRRWHLFNGRRIIAIATGPRLVPPNAVSNHLGTDCEYIHVKNDPRLRDVASFQTMLTMVRTTATDEATFYAHTKGTAPHHRDKPDKRVAIRYWRNRMYHELLDRWKQVAMVLRNHATCGTYKIDYSQIPHYEMLSPTGVRWGNWHYAGNFFWFRHDCIFRNPHWSEIPDDPYAAEMWLGHFLPAEHAATVHQPFDPQRHPTPDLYNPDSHPDPIK